MGRYKTGASSPRRGKEEGTPSTQSQQPPMNPSEDFLDEKLSQQSRETTKKENFKDRIHRTWTLLKNPKADPEFLNLPRGINNRIDPDKDPLRDKIRRGLRRRKKSTAPPVRQENLIPQFPIPIHRAIPSAEQLPPRNAPSIKPQLIFDNPGPAFDEWQNPSGAEHSVFYETAEEREQRNQATQRQRAIREASDRFLAQRRQKHIRNSIIGRAPPLSKRYIAEEAKRLAWKVNRASQMMLDPKEPGFPMKRASVIRKRPRVEVDPKELGLPVKGARYFQWDRAFLSKKKVLNLSVHKHEDEKAAMDSTSNVQTEERHLAEENHARVASWHDGSDNGSSDYGEKTESDEDSCVGRVNETNQNSEHYADLYRRELGTIPGRETEDDQPQPSLRSPHYGSSTEPVLALSSDIGRNDTPIHGYRSQIATPNLATTKGGVTPLSSGSATHAQYLKSGKAIASLESLAMRGFEHSKETTQTDYRVQEVQQLHSTSSTSHMPRIPESKEPELGRPNLQPGFSRLPQRQEHGKYPLREDRMNYPRVNPDKMHLPEDGPYPEFPGHNKRRMEALSRPFRRRAATTGENQNRRPHVQSQEIRRNPFPRVQHGPNEGRNLPPQGRDGSRTPQDGRSQFMQRPLEPPSRSGVIGSQDSRSHFMQRPLEPPSRFGVIGSQHSRAPPMPMRRPVKMPTRDELFGSEDSHDQYVRWALESPSIAEAVRSQNRQAGYMQRALQTPSIAEVIRLQMLEDEHMRRALQSPSIAEAIRPQNRQDQYMQGPVETLQRPVETSSRYGVVGPPSRGHSRSQGEQPWAADNRRFLGEQVPSWEDQRQQGEQALGA
jgi:hypothetical protein